MHEFPTVLENISDLSKQQIDDLLSLSIRFKQEQIPDKPITNNSPLVATCFLENSTRTKYSFNTAIHRLGCHAIDFDPGTSSFSKGESLRETLKTLQAQGVEACIIRTSKTGEFVELKNNPPLKLINAGDGVNQHPTQALLDLMTLQEELSNLNGKTITIMGDCRHSRVANSLMQLLPLFGMKVFICAPESFLPENLPLGIQAKSDLEECLKQSDIFYALRIQFERHSHELPFTKEEFKRDYGLTLDKLKKLNLEIPIYHPGPVNIGLELDQDIIDSPLYRGYAQVENSVFMRMAIVESMLTNGGVVGTKATL